MENTTPKSLLTQPAWWRCARDDSARGEPSRYPGPVWPRNRACKTRPPSISVLVRDFHDVVSVLMQAEYTRLIEAGVAPTPRQLQKSVEHLVPERHTRADWQRASAKNALLAARGLSSINQLSFLDKACILTVLRDHHDSSNFHQHADEFRSIVALGHRAINYRVTSLLDLVSARPPVHNYRTYLMHFALSEGWVIQHGKFQYWGADDARVVYKQFKIPQPELLPYRQFKHVGGADGMGAGILAHSLGMLAWWEIPPRDRLFWHAHMGKHMCVYPWEIPKGFPDLPLYRLVYQDYDLNRPDDDLPEFRL